MAAGVSINPLKLRPKYLTLFLVLLFLTLRVKGVAYNPRADPLASSPYANYICPQQCACYQVNKTASTPAVELTCKISRFTPDVSTDLIESISNPLTSKALFTCATDPYWSNSPDSILWGNAFSGLSSLRSLAFSRCAFSSVPGSAFQDLVHLSKLFIHGASISVMNSDLMAFTPGLETLQVTYSGLTLLPALCRTGSHLRVLNLTGNALPSFDAAGVRCTGESGDGRGPPLARLETLDLRSNAIKSWPLWLASSLPGLYYLSLGDNQMSSPGPTPLSGLPLLSHLDMSNNSITSFGADFFSGASRTLHTLLLSHNPVGTLPPGLLSSFVSLRVLDLSGMDLGSQVWSELGDLERLEKLNLSENRLQDIDQAILGRFTRLEKLHLAKNQISSLQGASFGRSAYLTTLDMSHNRFQRVPSDALNGALFLRYLYFDHNVISDLEKGCFQQNEDLELIDLSHNRLTSLDADLLKNQNGLVTLNLSYNKLNWLEDNLLQSCRNLNYLNVSHNHLQSLPKAPLPSRLEKVDFSFNQVVGPVPGRLLNGATMVKEVVLSHNRINALPLKLFDSCSSLVKLDLSLNEISQLEENVFSGATKLVEIDLSNNDLQNIGSAFSGLKSLKVLNLSYNKLTSIMKNQFPPHVEKIDLSNNRIASIQKDTFKSLSLLKIVNLRSNKLETISRMDLEVPYNPSYSPTFYLEFNPLVCDCELAWLKDWYDGLLQERSTLPFFHKAGNLRCTSPATELSYTHIDALDRASFLCKYDLHCEKECVCCEYKACFCKHQCPDNCSCYLGDANLPLHRVSCRAVGLDHVPPGLPEGTTELRLDGNNIAELPRKAFRALRNVQTIYLNNSNIQVIYNHTFIGCKSVRSLYLNDNGLTEISERALEDLESLEELYLHNNNIFLVDPTTVLDPPLLRVLTLHGNSLVTIDLDLLGALVNQSKQSDSDNSRLIRRSAPELSLSLRNNPWTCEKSFACSFLAFLLENSAYIRDLQDITCQPEPIVVALGPTAAGDIAGQAAPPPVTDSHTDQQTNNERKLLDLEVEVCGGGRRGGDSSNNNNNNMFNITSSGIDAEPSDKDMYVVIAVCIVVAFTVVLMVAVVVNRHLLQVLCFTWFGCRVVKQTRSADDVDAAGYEKYDAFICHAKKDEDFVLHQLVPRLEGDHNFRLCFPNRDFPCGECIAETIVRGVSASKRTVCVLSHNFLESGWCTLGFQTAHEKLLQERRSRIIIILLDDLEPGKVEDRDLKNHLRTRTYLKVGEQLFWEKLVFALPDVGRRGRKKQGSGQRRRQLLHAAQEGGGKVDTADLVTTRLPSMRDLEYMDRDRRLADQHQHNHSDHGYEPQVQQLPQQQLQQQQQQQQQPQQNQQLLPTSTSPQPHEDNVHHLPPYSPQQFSPPKTLLYSYQPPPQYPLPQLHPIPQPLQHHQHHNLQQQHQQYQPQQLQRTISSSGGGGSFHHYPPPHSHNPHPHLNHHPGMYGQPTSPTIQDPHYHFARTMSSPNGHLDFQSLPPGVAVARNGSARGLGGVQGDMIVAGDGRWPGIIAPQPRHGSSQGSFRNTAFYNSDDSGSTTGYHKGSRDSSYSNSTGGGGHYEEVGCSMSQSVSAGSTPIKMADGVSSTPPPPPPIPLIPKEGFVPVERLVTLNT